MKTARSSVIVLCIFGAFFVHHVRSDVVAPEGPYLPNSEDFMGDEINRNFLELVSSQIMSQYENYQNSPDSSFAFSVSRLQINPGEQATAKCDTEDGEIASMLSPNLLHVPMGDDNDSLSAIPCIGTPVSELVSGVNAEEVGTDSVNIKVDPETTSVGKGFAFVCVCLKGQKARIILYQAMVGDGTKTDEEAGAGEEAEAEGGAEEDATAKPVDTTAATVPAPPTTPAPATAAAARL